MHAPTQEGETVLAYSMDSGWTAGEWTGESDKWDEHFVIELHTGEEVRCHYEDIKQLH